MKPDDYCLLLISKTIIEGFDYKQGLAIFKTIVFLMESIDKDPQIETDGLTRLAQRKLHEHGYATN